MTYNVFSGTLNPTQSQSQDVVWDMGWGRSKGTCIRWECTLAPPGEYC